MLKYFFIEFFGIKVNEDNMHTKEEKTALTQTEKVKKKVDDR